MVVDQDRLTELAGRFIGDLEATIAAGNVVVGHRLGLYRMRAEGPAPPEQLAERSGTERSSSGPIRARRSPRVRCG